mmetsp:Transcript_95382/g.165662  ORF Transcript_95382/g.165662 Transcript_95382/m.165662 type:complete len:141 (-) Transcript_95382:23-445(-)
MVTKLAALFALPAMLGAQLSLAGSGGTYIEITFAALFAVIVFIFTRILQRIGNRVGWLQRLFAEDEPAGSQLLSTPALRKRAQKYSRSRSRHMATTLTTIPEAKIEDDDEVSTSASGSEEESSSIWGLEDLDWPSSVHLQ